MSGPFGSSQWMYQSGGFYGFEISNSCRFNDDDSAYLTFTPSANGNRTTWTWSAWIKRGNITIANQSVWGTQADGSSIGFINFTSSDKLDINNKDSASTGVEGDSTRLLRDVSAWYNIVIAFAGDASAQADRVTISINGESETYVPRGTKSAGIGYANTAVAHALGTIGQQLGNTKFDGYMADVNFIDGTALAASSFGEYKNGIWIPKDTSGLTFGDQGYRLEFKQSGVGTASASTIGADTSGNDNHWTSSGLAVNDQVPDSPTNNFATWNVLDKGSSYTLSEGNLKGIATADWFAVKGTQGVSSGKRYFEICLNSSTGISDQMAGLCGEDTKVSGSSPLTQDDPPIVLYHFGGLVTKDGSNVQTGLTAMSVGAVLGVAVDFDASTVQFYVDNSAQGTAESLPTNNLMLPIHAAANGRTVTANFGQDSSFAGSKTAQGNTDDNGIGDFYYTPPSGYLALCTANLPDPVIDPAVDDVPADYFNTVLYTGTGATQSITGVGFQPDWVWFKRRSATENHWLIDAVRGSTKGLFSNLTNAEATRTDQLTSFDADGFSLGADAAGYTNISGNTYVAWNWLAGNGTASNTDGSITSTVSVNQKAGFSVVGYTGNGTSGSTVGHGLTQFPQLILQKNRSTVIEWNSFTTAVDGSYDFFYLDLTNAAANVGSNSNSDTVFTVYDNYTNESGANHIAYCFHSVEGYSKLGSYTGNGSTDGPFVFTNHRPAWIMVKRTDSTSSWQIWDTARSTYNATTHRLRADLSNVEDTGAVDIDTLSNGFKLRNTDINIAGGTYIYMAFAEAPFKYANAR